MGCLILSGISTIVNVLWRGGEGRRGVYMQLIRVEQGVRVRELLYHLISVCMSVHLTPVYLACVVRR